MFSNVVNFVILVNVSFFFVVFKKFLNSEFRNINGIVKVKILSIGMFVRKFFLNISIVFYFVKM